MNETNSNNKIKVLNMISLCLYKFLSKVNPFAPNILLDLLLFILLYFINLLLNLLNYGRNWPYYRIKVLNMISLCLYKFLFRINSFNPNVLVAILLTVCLKILVKLA